MGNPETRNFIEILNLEYAFDPENTKQVLALVADYFEKHSGSMDKIS